MIRPTTLSFCLWGQSRSWWYSSWIYNYLYNKCLSPLKFLVRIPLRRGVLDTTLCYKVCQWLATGRWFSLDTPVSSTNKTDLHDITKILLKAALNTIDHPTNDFIIWWRCGQPRYSSCHIMYNGIVFFSQIDNQKDYSEKSMQSLEWVNKC